MRDLLRRRLQRFARTDSPRAVGDHEATVIAVAAQKGGVGKTTTAVHLAAGLARFHGQKVLLVDLDPQNHVAASLASQMTRGGQGLSAVLEEDATLEVMDISVPTDLVGLEITPPDPKLAETEGRLNNRIGKEFVLKERLAITRTYYDVIIFDCPPNQGNLTLNGLVAADLVLIPTDPAPLAIDGVTNLIETLARVSERLNPSLDLLGVLLTRYDGRTKSLNEAAREEMAGVFDDLLLPLHIGVSSDLPRAQHAGQNVFDFAPKSRGAAHYQALAAHVAAQLGH